MAYPQESFRDTTFDPSSFWYPRRNVVRTTTLRYQLAMLKKTGRYDAFKLKWHPSYNDPPTHWPVPNHLFWDSDVAKWIEGACYFLCEQYEEDIDSAVQELVWMIRGAQQEDGYINIHFTVVDPGKRFTNLRDLHELYNAGHLIEAAVIHHFYYKNNLLLDPIVRYVDLLYATFGPEPGRLHGYPGHPEIEFALLRLYKITSNRKHLDLAAYFISERGNPTGEEGKHFYDIERVRRGDREYEMPRCYPEKQSYWYQQAHKPILEQQTIRGHSVRAMYLLTAVADLNRIHPQPDYLPAVKRLWENMVQKKMYETGGIGAIRQWEGFGIDYFLPQATDEGGCYAETCASIGLMMLAERLLQLDLDAAYADVMELALYNTVLTSMSLDGKSFTYLNQLASSPEDPSKREEWFECACCPPNVTRTLGMLGGYFWTWEKAEGVDIRVHLFTAAKLEIGVGGSVVTLEQRTNWPWDGKVEFVLINPTELKVNIRLRIPRWADIWEITDGKELKMEKNYLELDNSWLLANPQFTLTIALTPRLVRPHPFSNRDTLCVARGPIVYCVEDKDNTWVTDHFKTAYIIPTVALVEEAVTDPDTNETYVRIQSRGGGAVLDLERWSPTLGSKVKTTAHDLNFIPFYFRANRGGRGQMRVGLRVLH